MTSFTWHTLASRCDDTRSGALDKLQLLGERFEKSYGKRIVYATAKFMLKFIQHESFRKIAETDVKTLLDFYIDQMQKSIAHERVESLAANSQLRSIMVEIVRRHYQLPCTLRTRINKCKHIQDVAQKSDPILLIGDDDLVSLELKRHGFTDVTVLDIDRKLLKYIESETGYKCIEHDLRQTIPHKLTRPYRVVSTDPPNEVSWIKLFMRRSAQITAKSPQSYFLLYTNPLSLYPSGVESLQRFFDNEKFKIEKHTYGENAYKMPVILKACLYVAIQSARIVTWSSDIAWNSQFVLKYFSSDTLLLKRDHESK